MTLPNFLIIGAPKAGTTSLKYALAEHPEVFMAPDKPVSEPHFLSYGADRWPSWAIKDQATYEALFDEAGDAKAIGEKSTWYMFSEAAPTQALELLPDVKAIAMLRDPVGRAYSSYRFNLQLGMDDVQSFDEALALEASRTAQGRGFDLRYFEAGLYTDQLQRWFDAFGRERVLVLVFEDLITDPGCHLREASAFLGIDATREVEPGHRNKTTSVRSPKVLRMANKARIELSWLPGPIKKLASGAVTRLNSSDKPPPDLRPETAKALAERYIEDVAKLSQVLDRDLEALWLDRHLKGT